MRILAALYIGVAHAFSGHIVLILPADTRWPSFSLFFVSIFLFYLVKYIASFYPLFLILYSFISS